MVPGGRRVANRSARVTGPSRRSIRGAAGRPGTNGAQFMSSKQPHDGAAQGITAEAIIELMRLMTPDERRRLMKMLMYKKAEWLGGCCVLFADEPEHWLGSSSKKSSDMTSQTDACWPKPNACWPKGNDARRSRRSGTFSAVGWRRGQFGASRSRARCHRKSLGSMVFPAPKVRRSGATNCPRLFSPLFTGFEKVPGEADEGPKRPHSSVQGG